MKTTKEMYPGCLYLFEGESSASSCFIQNEEDAKQFIILANQYLKDYIKIHEFNLTKDSWMMIVTIRSKEKIKKSYLKRRAQSQTCNRKNDHRKIWKIISEQMRLFLKHYVRDANKRSGRQGSLVKEPFKRSYFESEKEAQKHIIELRKQLLKRQQKIKKFRGRKKFYKITKKKTVGNIFLCSCWKESKKSISQFMKKIKIDVSALIDFKDFMTLKFVLKTLRLHSS